MTIDEFDLQIKESLFKEKIQNYYKKNKKIIILFLTLILLLPILFQFHLYFKEKKNEKLISEYVKAELLLNIDEQKGLKILEDLKNSNYETAVILAHFKLLSFYLEQNKQKKALIEINSIKNKFKKSIYKEISEIKKIILSFDNLNEGQLVKFYKNNQKKNNFELIRQKLIYDYYIKNKEFIKANQILNIK